MKEISLHILDIVQNSIAADASQVEIIIREKKEENIFSLKLKDDGNGMDRDEVKQSLDPFVTSRKTREVGLGLPFFKKAAENCNGNLKIESKKGQGTVVEAFFEYDHIDRAPLGDITGTIISLIITNPDLDFIYRHSVDNDEFEMRTQEIKKELAGVEINNPEIIKWIEEYIRENLAEIRY